MRIVFTVGQQVVRHHDYANDHILRDLQEVSSLCLFRQASADRFNRDPLWLRAYVSRHLFVAVVVRLTLAF